METFARNSEQGNLIMGLAPLHPGHAFNQLCTITKLLFRRFRKRIELACRGLIGVETTYGDVSNDCGDNTAAFSATCILF